MKKAKQILSVLLAVVMLVVAVPVMQADAAYENTWVNTGNQRVDIVEVAKTQIGYTEGYNNDTKYGDWYDLPNQPWCAMFVCWCANQAGISTDVIPRFSKCIDDNYSASGSRLFQAMGRWKGASYVPSPGDIIFIYESHVGIVEYVSGSTVHTIEGNYSDSVKRVTRTVGSSNIAGYGVPNYPAPVAPTWASMTIDKENIRIGEEIAFTMTSDTAVNYYSITIRRVSNFEEVASANTKGSFILNTN